MGRDRHFYINIVDGINTRDEMTNFLTLLMTLNETELSHALPSLCHFTSFDLSENHKKDLESICIQVWLDSNSSRADRRAALACLKTFHESPAWTDFYILAEAIEEPQFHIIEPVLPRMDSLVNSVELKELDVRLVKVILIRAANHSNGWIRCWSIEKAIRMKTCVIQMDDTFLDECIFDQLTNNDIFWRMFEKNELTGLMETLGELVDTINSPRKFLQSVERLTCPTAILFASYAVKKATIGEELGYEDCALFRRVCKKGTNIAQKSLRIVAIRNLIMFCWMNVRIDDALFEEIAQLVTLISMEATQEFVQNLAKQITAVMEKKGFEYGRNLIDRLRVFDIKTKCFLRELWLQRATERDIDNIELELSDELSSLVNPNRVESLLLLIGTRRSCRLLEMMHNQLSEFIISRVIMAKGTLEDFGMMRDLYAPMFRKYCGIMTQPAIYSLLQVLKEQRTIEVRSLIISFVTSIWDGYHVEYEQFVTDGIGMGRAQKLMDEMSEKDFNQIMGIAHSNKIQMFIDVNERKNLQDSDEILNECIDQLDIVATFLVKQKIMKLISLYIGKTNDEQLKMRCIKACHNIVLEEKKSANNLPAIEGFIDVCMRSKSCETISLFEDLLEVASQNFQIALALINGISRYSEQLNEDWIEIFLKLALFGPVPKKEVRVIAWFYENVYEEELMEKNDYERFDEIVQRTRMTALLVCVKKCKEWAAELTRMIIKFAKALDETSSRSFGLSMAHRQKTRAVELLQLLIDGIEDEEVLGELFEYSVSCIADPCQQFSIKLIVEWIIVRMAINSKPIFERLISREFEKSLASQRIGSISSWINILLLISRTDKEGNTQCLSRIVPWTSAQNFPVRCTAIAACRLMFSQLDKNNQKKFNLVKSIIEFDGEPAGNSKRVIDNLCNDFYFAKLHPLKHYDMQTVLIEIPKKTGMPPEETIKLEIIKELNDTQIRSVNEDKEFLQAPSDVYSALAKNTSSAPEMSRNSDEKQLVEDGYQRKIVKEEKTAGIDDDEKSLIVVASLVDKPNNLGGMCRTSEIFGVDTLVVGHELVLQNANFKALSMSSENWQKIEVVEPGDLLNYLQKKRKEGYCVIAAEQTTDSVMLHEFEFPKKALIIMGDEKFGVPVHLLRAVDKTVEIKQVGHTRSLNVHVTTALLVSKYAEQVMFK